MKWVKIGQDKIMLLITMMLWIQHFLMSENTRKLFHLKYDDYTEPVAKAQPLK